MQRRLALRSIRIKSVVAGILVTVTILAAFAAHHRQVLGQTCWTRAQVEQENASQQRCLYALYDRTSQRHEVWSPEGTSYKEHHKQPCATDITCAINPSHFTDAGSFNFNPIPRIKNIVKFFLPAYFLGYMCTGEALPPASLNTDNQDYIPIWSTPANDPYSLCQPQPTATPTVPPTATPTLIPSSATPPLPSVTPGGSCPRRSEGDVDCNGVISLNDFNSWRQEYYGELSSKNADFNASGSVTLADFEIWRSGYYPT